MLILKGHSEDKHENPYLREEGVKWSLAYETAETVKTTVRNPV